MRFDQCSQALHVFQVQQGEEDRVAGAPAVRHGAADDDEGDRGDAGVRPSPAPH